jgi:maleylacetoacetate isomerase
MKRAREEGDPQLTLYSYWRSGCSWRVRMALELKGLPYEYRAINLLKGEDCSEEYRAINPAGLLPTLIDGKNKISESLAILEYLEERYPGRGGISLLPRSFEDRAAVRRICLHIASGIQPIQNLGILEKIESLAGKQARGQWGKDVIAEGFASLEIMLKETGGTYCFGDTLTMADICLIPQVYNANRFGLSLEAYPTIVGIHTRLLAVEALKAAHPDEMPDAVKQ